jgi:hypothetical protein
VRLGTRRDDLTEQTRLARVVFGDHVVAFVCILVVLALQLGAASAS